MANITYDAETCTPGVTLTAGNQGANALLFALVGTPTWQATATAPIRGLQSFTTTYASGDSVAVYHTAIANTTQQKFCMEFNFASAPTADIPIMVFYGVGGACATVTLRTTGRVQFADQLGTTQYVTLASVGFPSTFTVDATIDVGTDTLTGQFQCAVYQNAVSLVTPMEQSGLVTGKNLYRTGIIASLRTGKISGTAAGTHKFDTMKCADGFGLQGAYAATTLPVLGVIDATGWTITGGTTILANLSDLDPATGATAMNPTSLALRLQLPGMVPPAGDFVCPCEGFRGGGSTSGSVLGVLYEGATLRATSGSPAGTRTPLATTDAPVVLTFLAANLGAITTAAWAAGLELRINATAA